jgi:hypothetical protein
MVSDMGSDQCCTFLQAESHVVKDGVSPLLIVESDAVKM